MKPDILPPPAATARQAARDHRQLAAAIAAARTALRYTPPPMPKVPGVTFAPGTVAEYNRTFAGLSWAREPREWLAAERSYQEPQGPLNLWLEAERRSKRTVTPSRSEARDWARRRDALDGEVVRLHNDALAALAARTAPRPPSRRPKPSFT